MPKATTADTSASTRLSVSNWKMMRRRDAPTASRMPISRWRATARASSKLATFAHPIIRMRPNAKKSGMNISMTSADSGTVPCLGSSTRLVVGPRRGFGRGARHAASPTRGAARAPDSRDTPGFSRPTMLTPTASSRASVLRLPRRARGGTGQEGRAAPSSPAERP